MLREKFWIHLKRESTQTLDSWVVTVKERAAECKFPADFYEQAVRDKLAFSCKEDTYKLKLYDKGAAFSLEKAVKILSLKEATKREWQESKTSEVESVIPRRNRPDLITDPQRDFKRRPFQMSGRNCGYCNRQHAPGRRNCPAADMQCSKCNKMGHFPIMCKSPCKNCQPSSQIWECLLPHISGRGYHTHLFQYFHGRTSCKPSNWEVQPRMACQAQDPRPRHADMVHWHRSTSVSDAWGHLQVVIWDAFKIWQRTCRSRGCFSLILGCAVVKQSLKNEYT